MKGRKITAILMLALGLMVWAGTANGGVYLTVNGEEVESITLEIGQSRTVEVVSGDSSPYVDYAGFDDGVSLGYFSHLQTTDEAGNLSEVVEHDVPTFYGYYVQASGLSPAPSAGVHFVFKYKAIQVGQTELILYDNALSTVIDSVSITVIPATLGTAFTYQGQLMDSESPANGLYDFRFELYNYSDPNTQTQIGSTVNAGDVDVKGGYFTVKLDFGSDPNIFGGDASWLQISVRPGDSNNANDFVALSPRRELTPAPYAIYAGHSKAADDTDTLDGLDSSAFAFSAHYHNGLDITAGVIAEAWLDDSLTRDVELANGLSAKADAVHIHSGLDITSGTVADARIVGTIARDSELTWGNLANIPSGFADNVDNDSGGDITGVNAGTGLTGGGSSGNVTLDVNVPLTLSGSSSGGIIRGISSHSSGQGVYGEASGILGQGVRGVASNTGTYANYGGWFQAAGNYGRGVYAEASNTNSGNYGGWFEAKGTTSQGVHGDASNTGNYTNYGGYFQAKGSTGRGVYGYGYSTGNATNYGGYFQARGTTGRGVYGYGYSTGNATNYGGYFQARGTTGKGVYGYASNTGNYLNYGGHFEAAGGSGYGVYGYATNAGNYTNYGGVFQAGGSTGRGVFGVGLNTGNSTNYGGYFRAQSSTGRGVLGSATNSGNYTNTGGYFTAAGSTGRGVYGSASSSGTSQNYGGYFTAAGATGRAVYGYASNTGDYENYGGKFLARGDDGRGVYGEASGGRGTGVFGIATGTGNVTNFGGEFEAAGAYGRGVIGKTTGSDGVGVWGSAYGDSGIGVRGYGTAYDFYASGPGVNYGSSSSLRWKTNIQPIDDPLEKISNLRGVYYDWDADHGGRHDMGMIAEEVGRVLPEIVSYEENGTDAVGMDYSRLTPLLIEAVKALKAENEQLNKRVVSLENLTLRLSKLEQQLQRPSNMISTQEGTE